jgi:methylglutaconyl-CoA hydratase
MSEDARNYATLAVSYDGQLATITLNRPEKRNAISYELLDELLEALNEVERSPAEVLILTGAGKAFCAGMDLDTLRDIAGLTPEESEHDAMRQARLMRTLFRSLYDFPKATVAAVNGAALAGGCGIATLCDFTLASTEAKFGYTEVRIGFIPALVSAFLLRSVGEKQARDLLLSGRLISADEAFRIGLVNEVVAPDKLVARAHELAAQLTQNCPLSLRATKRLLGRYGDSELAVQLDIAVEENARIRLSDDFREGIRSFLEKRSPHWSGR